MKQNLLLRFFKPFFILGFTLFINSGAIIANDLHLNHSDSDVINFLETPLPNGDSICEADFTYSIDPVDPYTVYFTSVVNGDATSWEWLFGDGNSSSLENPVHTFNETGLYTVSLIVWSGNYVCTDSVFKEVVIVSDSIMPCNANFSYWNSTPYQVQFDNLSEGEFDQWQWNFGDGTYSYDLNPVHIYTEPDIYSVSLIVWSDNYECVDSVNKTITIDSGFSCYADFSYTIDPNDPLTIQFEDLSLGDIVHWEWFFGDDSYSQEQNPTHTYSEPGIYTVQFLIGNDNGLCADSVFKEIIVDSAFSCYADFSYTIDPNDPLTVQFNDLSIGDIVYWQWIFGDGFYSQEQNPIHTYSEPGIYTVQLLIENANGLCADSVSVKEIIIDSALSCYVDFSFEIDSINPNLVYFLNQSQGEITNWYWNFGDGNTSTEENPVHTYLEQDIYTVFLFGWSDDNECADSVFKVITIDSASECTANFDYTIDYIQPDYMVVQFTDISEGNYDQWFWSFGDGTYSYDPSPLHEYYENGIYEVCLTVMNFDPIDDTLCYDTYCTEIVLMNTSCMANFSFVIDSINTGTVYFMDLSVGDIEEWYWLFSDGSYYTEQNPVVTFTAPGIYSACLTVSSDSLACSDTYCDTVVINIPGTYNFGGTVLTDSIPIDEGFAYAYQVQDGQITDVFASFISDYGYYDFFQIESSKYIVKSEVSPNSIYAGQYVPTYYGNVPNWSDASILDISGNIWDADITLIPIVTNSAGGDGVITGSVTYPDQKSQVEDVAIILMDGDDVIIGLDFTDENGTFIFEDLAFGTYKLLVEITGKDATPLEINLNSNSPQVDDLLFVINTESVTLSVRDGLPGYILHIGEILPNPVSQTATIHYTLTKSTSVDIILFSITGKVIHKQVHKASSGYNEFQLDSDELPGGMYYINIIFDGQYKQTRKFIKLD